MICLDLFCLVVIYKLIYVKCVEMLFIFMVLVLFMYSVWFKGFMLSFMVLGVGYCVLNFRGFIFLLVFVILFFYVFVILVIRNKLLM